jgi:hypothetical protein
MSQAALAELVADPTKKRQDKAVKIERILATKAKMIAESRGISVAEYLSDLLRAPIERDWPKAIKAIDAQSEKAHPRSDETE